VVQLDRSLVIMMVFPLIVLMVCCITPTVLKRAADTPSDRRFGTSEGSLAGILVVDDLPQPGKPSPQVRSGRVSL
jgi:hypothetical protein